MAEKSIFSILNDLDVKDKLRQKNGLTYLPWSSAWAKIKKLYPDAAYEVCPQIMDEHMNTRPWHDDGKTGWVEVKVGINGVWVTETLAIMDFRNAAIPVEKITSVDANKAIKRCLVKALALHGLGLYVYEGEDLPEESSRVVELVESITELVKKKCSTEKGKQKVGELCKAAEKEANPMIPDEDIIGNYKSIQDAEILEKLQKQLLAVRVK